TYAPAVYVTSSLAPYRAELDELQDVQKEALEATGRTRPGRNLLPPLTAEDVTHVRVSNHEGQTGRTVSREVALRRLSQLEEQTVENLRRFEEYMTRHDPARKQVEQDLKRIRDGSRLLEAGTVERLRETYAQTVIRPYLYFVDGSSRQLHMRQTGLLVAGPDPEVSWRQGPRVTRSDKIEITPLVQAGQITFYDAVAWEEAREKLSSDDNGNQARSSAS
ncbi:MAG TPA: hypothetical protein VK092_04395, partial [Deinococcales bacterium]|nr:hypothetical protein [Deinococcales bacterium]